MGGIGRSAIEELERSSNKEVVNPFIEGVKFIEKFQGAGTTFVRNCTDRKNCKNALHQNPDMQATVKKRLE